MWAYLLPSHFNLPVYAFLNFPFKTNKIIFQKISRSFRRELEHMLGEFSQTSNFPLFMSNHVVVVEFFKFIIFLTNHLRESKISHEEAREDEK